VGNQSNKVSGINISERDLFVDTEGRFFGEGGKRTSTGTQVMSGKIKHHLTVTTNKTAEEKYNGN